MNALEIATSLDLRCEAMLLSTEIENSGNNNKRTSAMTTTWSQCELQNLREAFQLLDTENNGEIFVEELRITLEELRTLENDSAMGRTKKTLIASLNLFSSDAKLSWSDFITLLTSPSPIHSKDDVEKIFDLFDIHGKGYINMADLRTVANELGEFNVSDAEIHEMIQRVSLSGRVTLEQFREIMKNSVVL